MLDYPELLRLWRTVPVFWRGKYRKWWGVPLSVIQEYKPGINLTESGKPTRYKHKNPDHWVLIGPALALILDRPELTQLVGGSQLTDAKSCWDYRQNQAAIATIKATDEAHKGYQYETLQVSWDWADGVSWEDRKPDTVFRIRRGQRKKALLTLAQVLTEEEFTEINEVSFSDDDKRPDVDLAAEEQYWQ